MGRAVDEVGVGDDCGGEAHDGAVEAHDEDFGVRGEGFCDVEVEGDEGLEELLAGFVGVGGIWSAYGDVCAAGCISFISNKPGDGRISFLIILIIQALYFHMTSPHNTWNRFQAKGFKIL